MLYARDGDRLLIHGSPASRLLRSAGKGAEVCVTVTLLDGLVLARSAFHHSVNYRSVVVMGRAEPITDLDERRAALDVLVEAIVPGRRRRRPPAQRPRAAGHGRPGAAAGRVLGQGPHRGREDDPEDMELPVWAGVVPRATTYGTPVPDDQLDPALVVPPYATAYARPI